MPMIMCIYLYVLCVMDYAFVCYFGTDEHVSKCVFFYACDYVCISVYVCVCVCAGCRVLLIKHRTRSPIGTTKFPLCVRVSGCYIFPSSTNRPLLRRCQSKSSQEGNERGEDKSIKMSERR